MKKKLIAGMIISLLTMMNQQNCLAQYIRTIAGNHTFGFSGDGGQAINAKMGNLSGIVTDKKGNIFVSDNANNVVRKIDTTGIITTVAGIAGTHAFFGDGGAATNAKLFMPCGLAIDKSGNLYIADNGNSAIRMIDTEGIITTVVGNGIWGHSGDGGPATAARINGGMGLAFDKIGNLYIADGNTCVRRVDTNGIITTFAGSAVWGYMGDGGAATAAAFAGPQSVAADTLGNVFICDATNQVIRKVNTLGIITTIAGTHAAGFSGDGGLAAFAAVRNPHGIIVDNNNNILFADQGNNRIRKIDINGVISTIAGCLYSGYSGDGGRAIYASLNNPTDLYINKKGNLLISEYNNYVVRENNYRGETQITTAPATSICTGTPVGFHVNSTNNYYGTQYQWTLNGTNVGSDTNFYLNSSLNDGDVVNCIITDAHFGYLIDEGSGTAMSVGTYFTPTVSCTAIGGDVICAGTTVSYLSSYTDGGLVPNLFWYVNEVLQDTGSGFSYVPADGDRVTIKLVSNGFCSLIDTVISSIVTMTVNPDVTPTISILSNSGDTVCAGSTVSYSSTISGGGLIPELLWLVNGAIVDSAALFSYSPLNGDVIKCKLFSNATCRTVDSVFSNTLNMTVNTVVSPMVSIAASSGSIITAGELVTMTANVTDGGISPTYQWLINSIPIPGENMPTFTTNSLTTFDTVTCKITGDAPCATVSTVVSNALIVEPSVELKDCILPLNKFSIFPNPNNGVFTLRGILKDKSIDIVNYSLTDITGRILYSDKLPVKNGAVNTQVHILCTLPNGMYLLVIKAGETKDEIMVFIER